MEKRQWRNTYIALWIVALTAPGFFMRLTDIIFRYNIPMEYVVSVYMVICMAILYWLMKYTR